MANAYLGNNTGSLTSSDIWGFLSTGEENRIGTFRCSVNVSAQILYISCRSFQSWRANTWTSQYPFYSTTNWTPTMDCFFRLIKTWRINIRRCISRYVIIIFCGNCHIEYLAFQTQSEQNVCRGFFTLNEQTRTISTEINCATRTQRTRTEHRPFRSDYIQNGRPLTQLTKK